MRAREESYSLVTTTLGRTEGEASWGLGRVDCSIDINEKLGTSCSRDVVFANSVSPNNTVICKEDCRSRLRDNLFAPV